MNIKNCCVIYPHFHYDNKTSSGRFENRLLDRGVQAKSSSHQLEWVL